MNDQYLSELAEVANEAQRAPFTAAVIEQKRRQQREAEGHAVVTVAKERRPEVVRALNLARAKGDEVDAEALRAEIAAIDATLAEYNEERREMERQLSEQAIGATAEAARPVSEEVGERSVAELDALAMAFVKATIAYWHGRVRHVEIRRELSRLHKSHERTGEALGWPVPGEDARILMVALQRAKGIGQS